MALQTSALLLLFISQFGSIVQAQDSALRIFTGVREEEELDQLSNEDKLEIAAKIGESHTIRLTAASQSAVAQEGVSLNIDCLPWLRRFPGGSIAWTFIQLDEFGDVRDPGNPPEPLVPNEDVTPVPRIVVGGEFNRWLNITRTVIIQGAEDPDRKIFMCEVCVARDTPFEICHTSNYTSRLIGSPPIILQPSDNFCRLPEEIAMLECPIRMELPTPLPPPSRSWFRNDVLVYSAILGEPPEATDFLLNNTILTLGILEPQVFTLSTDGSVTLQTNVTNITLPGIIPEIESIEEAKQVLYDLLLGTWTCEVMNELGTRRITYTIGECGAPPVIPQCTGIMFVESGATLPPGCTVCIEQGSVVILDCTVSAGEPPISYTWTDSTMSTISRNPRLFVREPGEYSCTASNLDDRIMTRSSPIFFSPQVQFKTSIVGRPTNGCERLRLNETSRMELLSTGVDTCIFFGETLNVSCTSSDPMAQLMLTSSDGTVYPNASATIVVTEATMNDAAMTFICQITNVAGPCGNFRFQSTVNVYDPARIDRTVLFGSATDLGAGRSRGVVLRANGSTVTLRCPTSGITEETTRWRRIVETSDGCLVEVDIDDLPEPQRSRHTENGGGTVSGLDDRVLTISPFTFNEEGSYVCRTVNIAGEDADVVSLTADAGGPEYSTTSFSECSVNCRDGVRNRSVTCRNSRDRRILPDFMCEQLLPPDQEPPASSETCEAIFPQACFLDPIWVPYQWSTCTRGCRGGYRVRDVLCQVPRTGITQPNAYCNHIPKPATYEFCPITCCVTDDYPRFCKQAGSTRCNEVIFQQYCCWTCGLRDIP